MRSMRLWLLGLLVGGVLAVSIGCAPSEDDLRAMVEAEVQVAVAKIVVPPGPQGAEGAAGSGGGRRGRRDSQARAANRGL